MEEVTIESVMHNFTILSTSNDFESFNQAKMWRKFVISDEKNIFLLINFFQQAELPPGCQIFIIQMIRDIIDLHFNSLPLSEIAVTLSKAEPSILINQAVTRMLGDLIGYTARLVYQNEHFFLFQIPQDQASCTKLQWSILHSVIGYIDQPRSDCNDEQNRQIRSSFKKEVLLTFFYLSLNAIDDKSQTEEAMHLLVECLKFDQNTTKVQFKFSIDETTKKMLDNLQDESLFDKFLDIVKNTKSPLSCDIVELMASILASLIPSILTEYIQLIEMIIQFCSEILNYPDFFKDRNNINSLKNIFQSFPKTLDSQSENFYQLKLELFSFLNLNLHENYLLAFDIMLSTSEFFDNTFLYISHESELYENYTNFLETFIETTLQAFQNDPVNVYNSLLLDSAMRKETKDLIKHLFNHSNDKKNDCIAHICELITNLTESPFDHVINLQVGFLLFVTRTAFSKNLVDYKNEPGSLIFSSAFNAFLSTNDNVNEYNQMLEENEPFAIEYHTLAFLKTFSKMFFPFFEKEIPEMADLFESPESVVVFVFQRFWNDMINNIYPEKSSYCLRKFITIDRNTEGKPSVLDVISTTDYPNDFLECYLTLPSKSIIYNIVINVMLSSEEVRPNFLESLEANFSEKEDDESLKKLFKIFSSWFDFEKDPEYWKTTYLYFISNFENLCFIASKSSPIFISLLKLMYNIVYYLPTSNPFKMNEPYSFEMMNKMMTLLANITNETSSFLKPIQIDESIYDTVFDADISDSKPITLSEAYETGLNERQMKMKMLCLSKTKNIHEDEAWSFIKIIIFIAKKLLNSSIPNFGIMEIYNDDCIFVFFENLINSISITTIISIVSQEQKYYEMITELSELIRSITLNFQNVVISNELFYKFILEFVRVTFLSHNSDVIKNNCKTLCNLIRGFSKPEEVEILRNHFILAFNAALYSIDCYSAREFVFEFTRCDQQFFAQIEKLIEEDLTQESCRTAFHDSFEELWKNIDEVTADNDEDLRKKMSCYFKVFLDSITPHSIKLYTLPSLAQYFDFRT